MALEPRRIDVEDPRGTKRQRGEDTASEDLRSTSSCGHSFDILPADLLQEIFSYLPLRARLLVLARVSHRWASAARRAPSALDDLTLHQATLAIQLGRLGNITSINQCPPVPVSFLLPFSLRHLRITDMRFARLDALGTQIVPSRLMSLSVAGGLTSSQFIRDLLRCQRFHLTSLEVTDFKWADERLFSLVGATENLSALEFPALRSLSISGFPREQNFSLLSAPCGLAFSLVQANASRLTSLSLQLNSWGEEDLYRQVFSLHFPSLTYIRLMPYGEDLDKGRYHLPLLAVNAPQLTSISLWSHLPWVSLLQSFMTLFVKIDTSVCGVHASTQHYACFASMPRLRSLTCCYPRRFKPFGVCTAIRELTVCSATDTDALPAFPRLTLLTIRNPLPFDSAAPILQHLPSMYNQLSRLSIRISTPVSRQILLGVLKQLEANGLLYCTLTLAQINSELSQLAAAFRWLQLTIIVDRSMVMTECFTKEARLEEFRRTNSVEEEENPMHTPHFLAADFLTADNDEQESQVSGNT